MCVKYVQTPISGDKIFWGLVTKLNVKMLKNISVTKSVLYHENVCKQNASAKNKIWIILTDLLIMKYGFENWHFRFRFLLKLLFIIILEELYCTRPMWNTQNNSDSKQIHWCSRNKIRITSNAQIVANFSIRQDGPIDRHRIHYFKL